GTSREDTVLFLDARHTFRQVDRAHRDFLPEQIEMLANIVRLYRGEEAETFGGSAALMAERFPEGSYGDVPGLCKVATISEIAEEGWSLNPGRYVGIVNGDEHDGDFRERLGELYAEFGGLSEAAESLRRKVDIALQGMLDIDRE